jgi:hypothetical protein
MEEKVAFANSS